MSQVLKKHLFILKLLYFFELAIMSCLYIYITPFMSEWGITASELAIINFAANMLTFFSKPCFGYIADRYLKYKQLILSLTLLCGVIYGLHLASPKHPKSYLYSLRDKYNLNVSVDKTMTTLYASSQYSNICWSSNLSRCYFNDCNSLKFDLYLYNNDLYYAQYVPIKAINTCESVQRTIFCENMTQNCKISHQSAFKFSFINVGLTLSATFWILGLAKCFGVMFYSSILSLTDAVTFITLGSNRSNEFGSIRMFGTVGALVFSLTMAAILEGIKQLDSQSGWLWLSHMQLFSQFTPCFIVAFIVFVSIAITGFFLRMDNPIEREHKRKQSTKSRFLEITSMNIFQNSEIRVFFVFSVFGGILLQVFVEYFFLIIYERYPLMPKYFPGLITVIMTLSEWVFLELSPRFLKFKDYEIWVSLSFLAWSLRWFCYLFADNFWLLLLTEVLHGPSFGLMLACLMTHIGKFGTERTQGRIQGLFSGVYFNIGGALGGLFGGIILNNFKMLGLFTFMFVFSLFCSLYYPLQVCVKRFCVPHVDTTEIIEVENIEENCNVKTLLPPQSLT